MKFIVLLATIVEGWRSHPSRGAWIEISTCCTLLIRTGQSHPSRGAWIEIKIIFKGMDKPTVAPLAGCVD